MKELVLLSVLILLPVFGSCTPSEKLPLIKGRAVCIDGINKFVVRIKTVNEPSQYDFEELYVRYTDDSIESMVPTEVRVSIDGDFLLLEYDKSDSSKHILAGSVFILYQKTGIAEWYAFSTESQKEA